MFLSCSSFSSVPSLVLLFLGSYCGLMLNKLRVRRLTLAPHPVSKFFRENKELENESDRILDYERFH